MSTNKVFLIKINLKINLFKVK